MHFETLLLAVGTRNTLTTPAELGNIDFFLPPRTKWHDDGAKDRLKHNAWYLFLPSWKEKQQMYRKLASTGIRYQQR